jgi:hypothetical protein
MSRVHPPNHLAVVLIPLYKLALSEAELFSIQLALRQLKDYPISIICPDTLQNEFRMLTQTWDHPDIQVDYFADKYFGSTAGYNRLLKSKFFYQHYAPYEYMLIAQPDALILSDQLRSWCQKQYSYIGAPFFEGFADPIHPLKFIGVGNGGISLRRIPDFIKAASYIRYIPNTLAAKPHSIFNLYELGRFIKHRLIFCINLWPLFPRVNEDVFWGMLIPQHFDFFKVPNPEQAIAFAFDAEPRHLFALNHQNTPFACHAWERYEYDFWKDILEKKGLQIPMHPIKE